MSHSGRNIMTKISLYALLTGTSMSAISITGLTSPAHAVTTAQGSGQITPSSIEFPATTVHVALKTTTLSKNVTIQATTTPVHHHGLVGSIVSGIGHIIGGIIRAPLVIARDIIHAPVTIAKAIIHAPIAIAQGIGRGISDVIHIPFAIASGIIRAPFAIAQGIIHTVYNVLDTPAAFIHTIGNTLTHIGDGIQGIGNSIASFIEDTPKTLLGTLFTIKHIIAGITNFFTPVIAQGLGLLSKADNFFGNLAVEGTNIASSILGIVSSSLGFISSLDDGISSASVGLAANIVSAVGSGISLGTNIFTNLTQLGSEYLPGIVAGTEKFIFGPGYALDHALASITGDVIGEPIRAIGNVIGKPIATIGHILNYVSEDDDNLTQNLSTSSHSIPQTTTLTTITPPQVALLG